ncbi:hypothetical protein EON65_05015 [archaeon]|nr:MAG: hypothetical protein EON65_05015 [archaeon]
MMKKGLVRFRDTPVAIRSEANASAAGGNTPLLKALALDDSTSILSVSNISDEVDKENSILSSGPSERANYVGRTPHSKVIEAAKVRKSFEELIKVVPLPLQVADMTFSTDSPIEQTVEMLNNEVEYTFNRTVQFSVAPATPAPMQTSELSGPTNQELTPTDFNITGLSNTPSSCGSDNFDLVGAVAENISSHMPSNSSKESRKFAGHTPFPDAKHRPALNTKSPDSDISQALWTSGSSQMSPMRDAHDVSEKLLTPHLQSMQSVCIQSPPVSASQQSPVVHSGSGSRVSSDAQSALSFLMPDYSPASVGQSPAQDVQRNESQQSTPMTTLPVTGNLRSHTANGTIISPASCVTRSTDHSSVASASVHQMSPQMISQLMSQGTPVFLISSANLSDSASASTVGEQTATQRPYIISPASVNLTNNTMNEAALTTPVAVPKLRANSSPNLAPVVSLAPTTPTPLLATISTPSSMMSAVSQLTSTSVSTFPQLPQQARSMQNTPAMVQQLSGCADLPSPVVLAMDGGVSRGRGPTAVSMALSDKPSRPPLPYSVTQHEQQQQRVAAPQPAAQVADIMAANPNILAGIAAQSPMRAPATSKSWFTPRNTRKQLPYQHGASRATHSQQLQQVSHTVSTYLRAQSASKAANQSVSVMGGRAEGLSVMDMDSLNDPAEVCNVSIQCDAASIARMLSAASGGKADAAVNTSFCSTASVQYGASSLASAGVSAAQNRNHEHHQLIKDVNAMLSPICDYDRIHDVSECEEGSIQSSYCLEDYLKEANQHIERNHVFYNSGHSHRSMPSPANQQPFDTDVVLSAPSSALSQRSRPNIAPNTNLSQQHSTHHSVVLDRTQTTGTTVNYPQPSLLSGAGRVMNGQVSYSQSPATSDCSSITLNKSQFPAQDLTVLTDVAVANYTLDMIDGQPTMMMDTILEEQSVMSAQSSLQGLGTPVHNTSTMTGPDMTLFLDISQHTNMYPKLAIKSLQRNSSPSSVSSVMDIKEVVLQAAPGEVTTVMLTFHNHKGKPIVLKTSSVCVRFDMSIKESDGQSISTQNNTEVFGISPGKLIIPARGEEVLFVSFTPHAGLQGVYTGAMQIKDSKKTFTMLLRGEAFTQYSIKQASSVPSTPDSKHQNSRVMSTIGKSVNTAQNIVMSAASNQSVKTPQSTKSGSSEKASCTEDIYMHK